MSSPDGFNTDVIQGDIITGLNKDHEVFLFFKIRLLDKFRQVFGQTVCSWISSETQCQNKRAIIAQRKAKGDHSRFVGHDLNVSFSAKGLVKLGLLTQEKFDQLKALETPRFGPNPNGDPIAFAKGQLVDAVFLGDPTIPVPGGPGFDPVWREEFKGDIDGVFLIAGSDLTSLKRLVDDVESAFSMGDGLNASIVEVVRVRGQARPERQRGHEHFGYADGLSQPQLNLTDDTTGPDVIPRGTIVVLDPPSDLKWTLNGSYMVFRQLEQLVPEFDQFLAEKGPEVYPEFAASHSNAAASDRLGAKLVGREKDGNPIENPVPDVTVAGVNLNDFTFDGLNESKCPFGAHIRKTNPRDDVDRATRVTPHRIMRHGIPYGPEMTQEEIDSGKTLFSRGLAFVCYQSHLENGFRFIQNVWANNIDFVKTNIGFDAIVGQINFNVSQVNPSSRGDAGDDRFVNLPSEDTSIANPPRKKVDLGRHWVVPKGGEYFFSPSLDVLRSSKVSFPGRDY